MLFDESTPERQKRARRLLGQSSRLPIIGASIPPAKPYNLLSEAELSQDRTAAVDCEVYPNYFLCALKCIETKKVIFFENTPESFLDGQKLSYVMHRFKTIGFNSKHFDLLLIQLAILGYNTEQLHIAAMAIIREGLKAYEFERQYKIKVPNINHIDLIEVAPLQASLKTYGARIHCERLQDLPYNEHTELTKPQAIVVRDYCANDLDLTIALALHLKPQIELREAMSKEYDIDLRSKSDAQVAEVVIGTELEKLNSFGWQHNAENAKAKPGFQFQYKVPNTISFKTSQLQQVLELVRNETFTVNNSGYPDVPSNIENCKIKLGGCLYRMGGGGLHSSEVSIAHFANEETLLVDRDVASYYPAIIINQGLYPKHLGEKFLTVYKGIINRRLKAKLEKQKLEKQGIKSGPLYEQFKAEEGGLKITTNGSFGKLGNAYSKLYAPDLLMQVTISGQLYLLMLIETIELAGIPVISANTDGVVIKCSTNRYNDLEQAILMWEAVTGFTTEETRYKALLSRDVNNYIAVKLDDACKTKGVYSEVGSALNSMLSKNPECQIISDALQAFLSKKVPLAHTIYNCTDIKKFVAARTVKGGAEKAGQYLGKTVRWYYAVGEKGTINYVLTGNTVPKTEGAKPLMILPPSLPADLNFNYYINEANEGLYDLGYLKRPSDATLF